MDHHHAHDHKAVENLKIAFWLNAVFAIIEIVGGIFTNSIAQFATERGCFIR